MSGADLKSHRIRAEREDGWRALDRILRKAETKSLGSLSDEDLVAMPVLYRSALSALASARATSLDAALIDYLESLCARAYFFLYGVRGRPLERIASYFGQGLPKAVQAMWRETLLSALIFFLGAAVAYFLVMHDSDWFYGFMPGDMSGGRDPSASAEDLRKIIYGEAKDRVGLSVFATSLFTHNASISLFAFALGFALCIPTAFLILQNGAMLGALLAVHVQKGLGFELGGWLAIHGVTEIFAIILSGAAGMRLGWNVGFPGTLSRLSALREAGRKGAAVMGGVVMLLCFAGLLEGFGRQLITNDFTRYGIAAFTSVLWAFYFYTPRRSRAVG